MAGLRTLAAFECSLALTTFRREVRFPGWVDPDDFFSRTIRMAPMLRSATFSACRTFRYSLSRVWNPRLSSVMFVGLNPSTADENEDDPTVRRCIGFARKWNCGGLILVNLFAYRCTDPAGLLQADDPIGPANDRVILESASAVGRIVLAWGTGGGLLDRNQHVLSLLPGAHCLGVTKDGHPKHPLYLAGSTRVRPFRAVLAAA